MKKIILFFPAMVLFACNQQGMHQEQAMQKADSNAAQPDIRVADSLVANTRVDSSGKVMTVTANKLIIPGKSIGLTKIGQDAAQTAALLGKPDDGDAAMGKSISTWYSNNNRAYKTQVFSAIQFGTEGDVPKVKSIRINNPFFETATGLKTGSNLKEILVHFPAVLLTGSYKSFNSAVRVYDDTKAGIAFEIDDKDICVGICVHVTDEKTFVQYLPFESSFTTTGD